MMVVVRQPRRSDPESGAVLRPALPSHDAPDAELVERARGGNHWAEEMLYRRHAEYIVSLCSRLLRHAADADDVVQDAFVAAFEQIGALREPAQFRRWLTSIAVHQAHRKLRRRKLMRWLGLGRTDKDDLAANVASTALSPEVAIELGRLDQVLTKLRDDLRLAWQLRYVEGCRLEEVAELCHCSLATAKRRIQKADVLIRKRVEVAEVADD
jgi:RNA polymerase sigma-70 factor, ECF subfamily